MYPLRIVEQAALHRHQDAQVVGVAGGADDTGAQRLILGPRLLEQPVVLHDLGFHQYQEISRSLHYLSGFRLGRDMGAVIIYCVALASAGVKVTTPQC